MPTVRGDRRSQKIGLRPFAEVGELLVSDYLTSKLAINPLTPNDHYSGRTTPLTSKRCILCI